MRIATIVGARPQFVKAAAVSRAIQSTRGLEEILVHTDQHYVDNMSPIFFEELEIPAPDINLGIGSGPHGAQTGKMLGAVEKVLLELGPDWVLVYGDTNSTMAGSLAAAKMHIPVAHVEAGLRSFNRRMPEEINRVITDHLSVLLFAPTQTAVDNLRAEGLDGEHLHRVGDVMYDAALYYGKKAERRKKILQTLGLTEGNYVVATIHRPENTDDRKRLKAILGGLEKLAKDIRVVLPLHPRTRKKLDDMGGVGEMAPHVSAIEPQGYLDMLALEKCCCLVATDSGGVQKEAFFYEIPCVTLRDETEWVELVENGWNRVVPPRSADQVFGALRKAIGSRGKACHPFGQGDAAEKIVGILSDPPEETDAE